MLALCLPAGIQAQTILLKDGKTHSTKEIRRDGNFLFYKTQAADASPLETVTPLNQIERIDFGELPAMNEARQLSKIGNAAAVIEKTAEPAVYFRSYSDISGNQWTEVMRMRLPALAVAGSEQQLAELQSQWTPTGDQEIDTAYRLILAGRNDRSGARTAWSALAQPGASSLSAGLSWLELGQEALQAKQWNTAIRAFLSVEVFLPQQRLLQPKALLGAAKAFVQKGELQKATALVEEVKQEYPSHAGDAAIILK
jgi:TolA-binding protein